MGQNACATSHGRETPHIVAKLMNNRDCQSRNSEYVYNDGKTAEVVCEGINFAAVLVVVGSA